MYLLRLDSDTVNTMSVQDMPDPIGDNHVIHARLDQHVHTGHNGRFGELPDVQLVDRHNAIDVVQRLADIVKRHVRRDGLHEDVRGGFD